jgi:hypothetical protein
VFFGVVADKKAQLPNRLADLTAAQIELGEITAGVSHFGKQLCGSSQLNESGLGLFLLQVGLGFRIVLLRTGVWVLVATAD